MEEEPLRIRRTELMLAYWVYLQGHKRSHPAEAMLEDCSEHDRSNFRSLGWVGNVKAERIGSCDVQYVSSGCFPPWLFQMPSVDFNIQQKLNKKTKQGVTGVIVQKCIEQNY